jgi:hypothetical protein
MVSREAISSTASIHWILAGIATGLGQAEWPFTELVEDSGRVSLFVFDARATSPGELGTFRVLDVSPLRPELVAAIRKTSERCYEWLIDGTFTRRKFEVDQRIASAHKALHPSTTLRCTLDTIQYQAISNFVACIEPAEVSALIGDMFLSLPNFNYTHAAKAWTPSLIGAIPRPNPRDINRYRRIEAAYSMHLEVKTLKQTRLNAQKSRRARRSHAGFEPPISQ